MLFSKWFSLKLLIAFNEHKWMFGGLSLKIRLFPISHMCHHMNIGKHSLEVLPWCQACKQVSMEPRSQEASNCSKWRVFFHTSWVKGHSANRWATISEFLLQSRHIPGPCQPFFWRFSRVRILSLRHRQVKQMSFRRDFQFHIWEFHQERNSTQLI